jgi:hypothetical protein
MASSSYAACRPRLLSSATWTAASAVSGRARRRPTLALAASASSGERIAAASLLSSCCAIVATTPMPASGANQVQPESSIAEARPDFAPKNRRGTRD